MHSILNRYKAAFGNLPREVWLLSLVIFVNRCGAMVLFFLSLYLTRELGFSLGQAGILMSIYGCGFLFGSLVGGILSDRIGAYRVQFYSLGFTGLCLLLFPLITSALPLACALFMLAVFEQAFRPANAAALAHAAPPDLRPRAFALNRMAINLGVSIGPAFGGVLASLHYNYIFWADGGTCIFAALLLRWLFDFKKGYHAEGQTRAQKTISPPWKDGAFLFFIIIVFGIAIIFNQLFSVWPIHLREALGVAEAHLGMLMALNAFIIVLIEMPLIHALEKHNPLRIIAIGTVFLSSGFGLLGFGGSMPFLIMTIVLWTVGEMLIFSIAVSYASQYAGPQNRGRYMGLYAFALSLSFVLGPLGGTRAYAFLGDDLFWRSIWVSGFFVLAGILVLNKWPHFFKGNRPAAPEPL